MRLEPTRTFLEGGDPTFLTEFERCSQWLDNALDYSGDTHDIDHVFNACKKGECQFWPGKHSAVVTEIYVYPNLKACSFFLAGGEMSELREMCKQIETWAKSIGCTRMLITGRKGWARTFLKDDGYEAKWAVLAKDI